jgi:hypothetical protein
MNARPMADNPPPPQPDPPPPPVLVEIPQRPRVKGEIIKDWEKKWLYIFFAAVVIAIGLMQLKEAHAQSEYHHGAIEFANKAFASGQLTQVNYLEFTTSESMISDLVSLRHAGLFFGIIAIALGCMLVLTGIETGYQLSLDSKEIKGSLNSASPGLVLITLGLVLSIASLYRNTSIALHPDTVAEPDAMPSGASATPAPPPASPSFMGAP